MVWTCLQGYVVFARKRLGFAIVFALCIVLFSLTVSAQSNNTTANANSAPTPTATPEPTPIGVSSIVAEAEAVAARLRAIRADFAESSEVAEINSQLQGNLEQIEGLEARDTAAIEAGASLDEIRAMESEWQNEARRYSSWNRILKERIALLDKSLTDLSELAQIWRLTLGALRSDRGAVTDAAAEKAPPELIQRANEVVASIEETRRLAQERRSDLLAIQSKVGDLESRARSMREDLRTVRNRALTNLFRADEPPIWQPQGAFHSASQMIDEAAVSLSAQFSELRSYLASRTERAALHGLFFILVVLGLYWARSRVKPFVEKEPKLEKAAQIFSLPIATGLILSILISGWIYPQAPRLLTSLLGAAALVPVVILLRRMVERPLFIILNVLVMLYFIDRLRDLLVNQPTMARLVFLIEMLGAILFLVWFLKSKSLSGRIEAAHYNIFESIRKVVPFVLAIFIGTFIANALGFVSLANLVGNGLLGSAYLAIVLYTAVQIIRGIIIFALRVPPLSGTLVVQNNRPIIRERSVKIVRWIAILIWVLVTLNLFSIRDPIFSFLTGLFTWSATVGTITFSLGSVVLFFVMIWVAVLISRFLRFILEEDVYPRIEVSGGVSYAVSTMLHYSILVTGFMIAVGVLGVDFTKFALIAGAVGIGIGFGLQNIINNFVSGLILLVERPVKVDDTVQIGEHTGSLKQIGLRASVLRKVDGSDVIVPNSQLISEEVINWTMSDEKRRIDIPFGVAYGTSPATVMDLLAPIAGNHHELLHEPPPSVLFIGMGESSLDFEMRVWTGQTEGWVGLRSQLMTEVYEALTNAGIEIPFPQRDLNIRDIDDAAAQKLRAAESSTKKK